MVSRFLKALEVVAKVASAPEQFVRDGNFTIGDKDWLECPVEELRQVLGHLKARSEGNGFFDYANGVHIRMLEERIEEIENGSIPNPGKQARKRISRSKRSEDD